MSRRLVSIVLSLMLMVSMLLLIPTTASAVDTGEMALTESVEVTVHKGDVVSYWIEVAIPQDSIDVAGWTIDMYYDNAIFALNEDFARGYGFASGTKAVDYVLGLSDEEPSFPGGSITQGTLRPELGRVSVSDANPNGLKFKGKTTKVVCVQLQAVENATTNLSYRMRDLADTNLELSFIEKPSYQPAGGAEFALKHSIVCDHEPIVEPTEPATEPATEPVTEPATEPVTEPVTEPDTEPATEPDTEPATKPATEPATKPATAPTSAPTSATNATNATTATNATSATTASNSSTSSSNTSTSTTGKVATGDASSVAMLLAMLMISAGTVLTARRKFASK